ANGSCPWAGSWARAYGARLRCRSPGSNLHRPPRPRRLTHTPPPHRLESAPNPKAVLRAAAMARRDALSPREREAKSQTIAARCRPILLDLNPACVAGYAPIRSELDPSPVLS